MQDAAEAKASAAVSTSVKAVESAEAIGVVVPEQDAAEAKVSMTLSASVKAVEPAEVIGVVVPVPNAAEVTVVTLLRRIKKDAAEKNTYIGISFTHPAARWDCPSCCRLY